MRTPIFRSAYAAATPAAPDPTMMTLAVSMTRAFEAENQRADGGAGERAGAGPKAPPLGDETREMRGLDLGEIGDDAEALRQRIERVLAPERELHRFEIGSRIEGERAVLRRVVGDARDRRG